MNILVLSLIQFLCGSLMFSYWLGLIAKKDITAVGDGNPGAYNLWHSTGYKIGIVGCLLDFFKGYFPLVLFLSFDYVKGFAIIPIAIAPVLGHAFSPFVNFKGGKAVAVTFGVWSAVTNFHISLVYAFILAFFMAAVKLKGSQKTAASQTDAFMVVLGMAVVLAYLFMRNFSNEIILLCLLNLLILAYKNKMKLYTFYQLQLRRKN